MADRLIVERLEFEGFVGVTESERRTAQPLAVDLELIFDLSEAASTDDLKSTIDYAKVADKIVATAKQDQFTLIETLAEKLAQVILAEFPVRELELWIRKLRPPLNVRVGSVGVRINRVQVSDSPAQDGAPAHWLVQHRRLLKPGRALDLACGQGRNTLYLAQEGFHVDAWDRDQESLDAIERKVRHRGLSAVTTRRVDLEQKPDLPGEAYDLIVVFYYLHRDLIPQIKKALAPGGVVVYETFLIDNHERFNHPRRKEFCLAHNELLTLFAGLRTVAYREGPVDPDRGPFVASLVAERS